MSVAGVSPERGSHFEQGYTHGRDFAAAICRNVAGFFRAAATRDVSRARLLRACRGATASPARLEQLEGIAAGAAIDPEELIAYDLHREKVMGDGCTVLAALGQASASGATIFMKNSDQTGGWALTGEGFDHHKEINVVVDVVTEQGRRIVGVAAAGSTGLKMGVNDAGVVAGSNIARTTELAARESSIVHLRGADRSQIIRLGLEHDTCDAAARFAVARVIEHPTDTPGNIEFADRRRCFVIESSYRHWAVQELVDELVCRTNQFTLLAFLNDPNDESSRLRERRGMELLLAGKAKPGPDDLVTCSQDHGNGPGLNSICRHSDDPTDETSLSAMVVALHPTDPRTTEVRIALGKPCWAWPNRDGSLTMKLSDPPSRIPSDLRSGDAWRRLYKESVAKMRVIP